ncbi:pseudouridine synthase [Methyloversatilis thermotolerans]|uniref:pseudouridine synthase n=1 Tax=Methyloversatilis thermotolerans TaxID=1346290 RepID=UPI00036BCD04|nr:pseudouridine synthase [Methyloversatilis thermotolerans]
MLSGPQNVFTPMTTRPKLGLPRKSDDATPTDRNPARKPVRNSTAKSRTLSRNTKQVAPAAKPHAQPAAKDAPARKPRAARPDGDRPPRPVGEKRAWTPRPERDARAPRAESAERKPWENRERPVRSESGGHSGDRPPRKEFGDRPPRPAGEKRAWTPRPERDARAPRAESAERKPWESRERPARSESDDRPARAGGDFTPRSPKAAPLRPAKAWDERDTDRLGRVQAEKGEDGDDAKHGIRVSRWLADRGAASRREADDWIARGWVTVDGEVALLGQRVLPHQKVEVHKQARADQALRVTVLMHKPVGYVSGQAEDGHEPASVLFLPENQWAGDRSGVRFNRNHLRGLAPAGRLDIDSHGLLVLTQDGRIARQLIGEDSTIEKEYLVRVRTVKPFGPGALSESFPAESLKLLNHGLSLDGEALKPAKVSWQNEEQLRFVLREGKKRQIRRMCEAVGLEVVALKRVRIGRIPLADLPVGKWRYLRRDELF